MFDLGNESIFASAEYKRSRNAYTILCMIEYFITILVDDAFLAKLLGYMGISDSLTGIITSVISLATVFQLGAIFVLALPINRKKAVTAMNIVSYVLFGSLYLLPFLNIGVGIKTVLVAFNILLAYAAMFIASPMMFQWANSYVAPTDRAHFSAVKEVISLIGGIIFSTAVGYIMDKYEAASNLKGAFLFVAISVFVLTTINFFNFVAIKNDTAETKTIPFKEAARETVFNGKLRKIIVMTVLYNCARYSWVGFMGVFKTKDLALSIFAVQIINTLGNFARMVFTIPLGKYSNKKSFAKGIELSTAICGIGFLLCIFTTPKTRLLVVIVTILYNVSIAGYNQNSFNVVYSYVDSRYISHALAIKNSIGGLCGFSVAIASGKIVDLIRAANNTILGIRVYPQQALSIISFAFSVITVLYIKFKIEKETVKIQ